MFRDQSQDVIKKVKKKSDHKKGLAPSSRTLVHHVENTNPSSTIGAVDTEDVEDVDDVIEPEVYDESSIMQMYVLYRQQQQQQLMSNSVDTTAQAVSLSSSMIPSSCFPPSQEEAVCFFMHSGLLKHFVWTGEQDKIGSGRLMAARGSVSHQAMISSMGSVGMALLLSRRKSGSLGTARREFASAVNLVNSSLSDRGAATTHCTLTAVMLLAVFEVCVYSHIIIVAGGIHADTFVP